MPKQVIIIRKDLNMRKGKMAAQGAHASLGVLLDENGGIRKNPYFQDWLQNGQTKIVLGVDSEQELQNLFFQAAKAKLPVKLVVDAGKTEFDGISTKTAIAIGPWDESAIDEITGDLTLL